MRCAGIVLAAFMLAGCESPTDYSSLELVDVTGKVTMDGQPLAGATVRFEGPPNRFADGMTDAAGQYRLMYDSNQPGCMPGEKIVRIVRGSLGEGSDEGGSEEDPDRPVAASGTKDIPAAYNSQSTLKANVSSSNKTFNFDLKSQP
jgi:hypothetical protein